jgi:hypothetical protein
MSTLLRNVVQVVGNLEPPRKKRGVVGMDSTSAGI